MDKHEEIQRIVDGKDWKKYNWGEIIKVDLFGDYAIYEYISGKQWDDAGKRFFHTALWTNKMEWTKGEFVWYDPGYSYGSFDEAVIGVVSYKHDGLNSQAASYFCKMIGII